MCIDRDYVEVATAFPFKQTLVAVNTTWDDRDMGGLSPESVKALARAKLTIALPTTVAFVSSLGALANDRFVLTLGAPRLRSFRFRPSRAF